MTHKRFFSFLIFTFFITLPAICVDWPQILFETDSICSFFGSPKGDTYSNSLQFLKQDAVTAADSGTVLIRMNADTADMGWFQSTLGNTIILKHQNDIMTVYGNMDSIVLDSNTTDVIEGNLIGESGASGWQDGFCSLEFQVIDTKVKTIINPLILMPHTITTTELPVIENLTVRAESGTISSITPQGSKLNAGIYSLYIGRQPKGMTYRTSVAVNGAVTETITYNMLKQENNRLCFMGKRNYTYEEIFTDENLQFIAEVILSKGKNTISITVSDVFGKEKTATYSLEVN
ncbi:MAG: M23 family metallopeptidase [Treponemataceae bacterium]|nr:M23 family metallopeptidase [Treponemataceae bacterium]